MSYHTSRHWLVCAAISVPYGLPYLAIRLLYPAIWADGHLSPLCIYKLVTNGTPIYIPGVCHGHPHHPYIYKRGMSQGHPGQPIYGRPCHLYIH
ncbi:hypothetical protein MACK_003697 [Theileria orientalis]|uniref:Uncharacterized protein n=1 Tax=Theileria orientalis TaxID=68886 RepID=A0A976SIQ7_THEOR|nr:hypothetical protein MACK_003697 [Theileria orientalis]